MSSTGFMGMSKASDIAPKMSKFIEGGHKYEPVGGVALLSRCEQEMSAMGNGDKSTRDLDAMSQDSVEANRE